MPTRRGKTSETILSSRHLQQPPPLTVVVDRDLPDGMIARHAVTTLQSLAQKSKQGSPFFVAVGFHKPHLPHVAPKKYFDLYPIESVSLPANEAAPSRVPVSALAFSRGKMRGSLKELFGQDIAWNQCGEFLSYDDNKAAAGAIGFGEHTPFNASWTRWQRQAYFAAASFMDAQLAKVMGAMDSLELMDETIITLWGDQCAGPPVRTAACLSAGMLSCVRAAVGGTSARTTNGQSILRSRGQTTRRCSSGCRANRAANTSAREPPRMHRLWT